MSVPGMGRPMSSGQETDYGAACGEFRAVTETGIYRLLEADSPDAHQMLLEYIRDQFRSHFNASVSDDTSRLIGIFKSGAGLVAACGIRTQADGFFSEHYLEMPLMQALAAQTEARVELGTVVEICHFAISTRRNFSPVIALIANGLARMGFRFVVCTATRCMVRYFAKRHLTPIILKTAEAAALPEEARNSWGDYYLSDPAVAFGPISSVLQRAPR